MTKSVFGEIDGVPVFEIPIGSKAGAKTNIITFGAVIRDLVVPINGEMQRVTLGLNTIEDYLAHSPHFGAVAGRVANRVAGGQFMLDGLSHTLARKPGETNTLHGGPKGFGVRNWTLIDHDSSSVTLELKSSDGDQGFPGALTTTCVYRMIEPATLRVELIAVTDKPTVVNLTQHAYFNLDGSPDILDHEVTLYSDFYTPTGADLIPTGEVRSVEGTPYDFRSPRPIRNAAGATYDTNYVAARSVGADGLALIALVRSPKNGLTLSLSSSEVGVQFYDAAKLNIPVAGLDGARYGGHAGFCLEPQAFPDSPNRRQFPDTTLRPGGVYRHVSEFRFA